MSGTSEGSRKAAETRRKQDPEVFKKWVEKVVCVVEKLDESKKNLVNKHNLSMAHSPKENGSFIKENQ